MVTSGDEKLIFGKFLRFALLYFCVVCTVFTIYCHAVESLEQMRQKRTLFGNAPGAS